MSKIEANWDYISAAIHSTIELIYQLGYNRHNLTASNAIIPIAYFIYKNKFEESIVHSNARDNDRKAIQEWLARVLLKGTFGGTPDNIYPRMREIINQHIGSFPLQQIITHYRGQVKSISFTSDDIDTLLELEYGHPKTFCTLSLLYSGLKRSTKKYHQDHIHPKAFFQKKELKRINLTEEQIKLLQKLMDKLPNLQLLPETINYEKNKKPFTQWLKTIGITQMERESILRENYINLDQSLAFEDFLNFYTVRKATLKQQLQRILGTTDAEHNH